MVDRYKSLVVCLKEQLDAIEFGRIATLFSEQALNCTKILFCDEISNCVCTVRFWVYPDRIQLKPRPLAVARKQFLHSLVPSASPFTVLSSCTQTSRDSPGTPSGGILTKSGCSLLIWSPGLYACCTSNSNLRKNPKNEIVRINFGENGNLGSNSALLRWHTSINVAKWTFFLSLYASRITPFYSWFCQLPCGFVSSFFHSLSTAAFASGIFIACGTGINLWTKL